MLHGLLGCAVNVCVLGLSVLACVVRDVLRRCLVCLLCVLVMFVRVLYCCVCVCLVAMFCVVFCVCCVCVCFGLCLLV